MKKAGWLFLILGILVVAISLGLRGTDDYGYGQYPWMEQASFAGAVDATLIVGILLGVLAVIFLLIGYLRPDQKSSYMPPQNNQYYQSGQQSSIMGVNTIQQPQESNGKYCSSCGNFCKYHDAFCSKCGTSFDLKQPHDSKSNVDS